MGVGISAYFRKYPSTSCTSERHIPHALTSTRISSGSMSGTGTSSRTGGLPYSCIRAALISASFPVLVRRWSVPASGGRSWSVLGDKCGYGSLGNRNVLLNGPGTRSNGADYASLEHAGYAPAKDDNFAGHTLLNT